MIKPIETILEGIDKQIEKTKEERSHAQNFAAWNGDNKDGKYKK